MGLKDNLYNVLNNFVHGTPFCGVGFFHLWSHVRAQKSSDLEAFFILGVQMGMCNLFHLAVQSCKKEMI